jgi:hypothetical protein
VVVGARGLLKTIFVCQYRGIRRARQFAEASFEGNRQAEVLQTFEASPFETTKAELVNGIVANFEF